MLNGLDLFSGIGGLTLALQPWVRPVTYCESNRYCQSVLLSRMQEGNIGIAPIWDDVRTLRISWLPKIDIIYAGFPCQDISTAGFNRGLGGQQSSLFYQITRLAEKLRPSFIFLENIAQGINRFEQEIAQELSRIGFEARTIKVSAFQIGANQERLRWFCLAYSDRKQLWKQCRRRKGTDREEEEEYLRPSWWNRTPKLPRMVDGISYRVDRISALGNSVVPLQARQAFKCLVGLEEFVLLL